MLHRITFPLKQFIFRYSLSRVFRKGTASAVPIDSPEVERVVIGAGRSRPSPPRGAMLSMAGHTAASGQPWTSVIRAEQNSLLLQPVVTARVYCGGQGGTAEAVPFRKKTAKQVANERGYTAKKTALVSLIVASAVSGQSMDVGQSAPPRSKGGHVQFVAEPQTVVAGKPTTVLLHFKVDPGFHINSHTPRSELLIPTKIAVEETPDLNVKAVDFPNGIPYSFSFEPKEKLDVYTGEFTLTAHVTAKPGARSIKAALRYQACDAAACYPPKLLPVEQPFTAK